MVLCCHHAIIRIVRHVRNHTPSLCRVLYVHHESAILRRQRPIPRWSEGEETIEPTTLARILAETASEAKAEDVVVLDIHDLTVIADLFVICSADNERLMRAISRQIQEATDKIDLDPRRVEGSAESGWILLDYADVVVHIFGRAERQFYRLEDVWSAAQTLLVIQ